MSIRGDVETLRLKENTQSQVERLLTQLQDLEEMKMGGEIDEDEYNSSREDTVEQLKEFEDNLQKLMQGDMSLVDALGSAQMAIQDAIRCNSTPEVGKMFAKKQVGAVRTQIAALESELKLGRIPRKIFREQCAERLRVLQKLNEPLSAAEQRLLDAEDAGEEGGDYIPAGDAMAPAGCGSSNSGGGGEVGNAVLATAAKDITVYQQLHAERMK